MIVQNFDEYYDDYFNTIIAIIAQIRNITLQFI